jgi:hypothetical protein
VREHTVNEARDLPPVDAVEQITPEWLTEALAVAGAKVVGRTATPVGTGQVADTFRFELTWEPPEAGPPTVVAKVTAVDQASRNAAQMTRTYELEAAFYRELADDLLVRTPRCYWAHHDPTGAYVVLMDDLAPAVQGDQLAGCSVHEARAAIDELARLHAPRWGDPALADIPWLHRHDPAAIEGTGGLLTMLGEGFLERYEEPLDPEVAELIGRLMPRVVPHFHDKPGPWTVQHSDYRLDNLLFGPDGSVTVVDWQTVGHGPGVADLSYFVGAGLPTEARREHERDLVEHYRRAMAGLGVELDPAQLWEDYRRYTFSGLVMAIGASMIVERTDRGDLMFMAMANRHGRHALDLESESLIPA